MSEFCLHPEVYKTGALSNLLRMLERIWVRNHTSGDGILYIISGFGNYNGGVRFYPVIQKHISDGGRVISVFSGSTAQHLTSRQLVTELLNCGAEVHIINRKRMVHAKCYGSVTSSGQYLIVSSGNFTGPGMSQNVEASVLLDYEFTSSTGFDWSCLMNSVFKQNWLCYSLDLNHLSDPGWNLLYDESVAPPIMAEAEKVSLVIILSHSDTVRIQAVRHSKQAKGTQYFWLSKDCYDFFPPLTIPNVRGTKKTYSALITLHYIDLQKIDDRCRVTFEAENNLDFRLGTGKLRYTKQARAGDIAVLTRTAESTYELRLVGSNNALHPKLSAYAVNFVGHQGKRYGFISNNDLAELL